MCNACGCGAHAGTQLRFVVEGYTEESARCMEKVLLGMPGVLHVHIHAHDGETTIDYQPTKTPLSSLAGAFEAHGLKAIL